MLQGKSTRRLFLVQLLLGLPLLLCQQQWVSCAATARPDGGTQLLLSQRRVDSWSDTELANTISYLLEQQQRRHTAATAADPSLTHVRYQQAEYLGATRLQRATEYASDAQRLFAGALAELRTYTRQRTNPSPRQKVHLDVRMRSALHSVVAAADLGVSVVRGDNGEGGGTASTAAAMLGGAGLLRSMIDLILALAEVGCSPPPLQRDLA
jgi:hypothetical protein